MRLTVPEPSIELYEDGFDEHDKLSRKSTGEKLSELVERIDDPLVIALDGAWGSGKSFFLKCWVGEHLKRKGNTTQTVYFDAFKHDFLDDPLIALTGAIAERFEEADDITAQKAWKQAKQVAPALGRALVRTGVSVATAGLVTKADELAEAAINTVSGELDGAVAEFWKRENGKRAAMNAFRRALIDLTEPKSSNGAEAVPTKKLVIVVDELDRCRPDYALSLLETIKHFFDVAGVHFILGVNLTELQNCVRARYGEQTNSNGYLQKFFNLQFELPIETRMSSNSTLQKYLQNISDSIDCENTQGIELLNLYTKKERVVRSLSFRDLERLSTLAIVTPRLDTEWGGKYAKWLIPGLLILKVKNPKVYSELRVGKFSKDEVLEWFGLTDDAFGGQAINIKTQQDLLTAVWQYYLDAEFGIQSDFGETAFNFEQDLVPDDLRGVPRTELLPTLINQYLEHFQPSYNR